MLVSARYVSSTKCLAYRKIDLVASGLDFIRPEEDPHFREIDGLFPV